MDMSKSVLFDSWHQWKVCVLAGVKNFGWGMYRIVTCIILGACSLVRAAWNVAVGFVGRHPNISLGVFVVVTSAVWLLMFAQIKATKVGLEAQRDSVAYEFSHFKESHGYE